MSKGTSLDKLNPDILRRMSYEELIEVCKKFEERQIDWIVVKDLIKDRNDFKLAYFTLFSQLQDLGIKPAIDYYENKRKEN